MPRHPRPRAAPFDFPLVLTEPELGHIKLLVLDTIARLGADASARGVHQMLSDLAGPELDHAQVYVAIRRLDDLGFIAKTDMQRSESGPPRQLFAITTNGRAALRAGIAHHKELARFLERPAAAGA